MSGCKFLLDKTGFSGIIIYYFNKIYFKSEVV